MRVPNFVNEKTGEEKRFLSPYDRRRIVTVIEGESKTHESHADSTDVNKIIEKYKRTGELPPPARQAQYGDVTSLNKPMGELVEETRAVAEKVKTAKKAIKKSADEKAAQEKAEFEAYKKKQAELALDKKPDPKPDN